MDTELVRVKDLKNQTKTFQNKLVERFPLSIVINQEIFWACFLSLCDWFKNSRHLFNQSDARHLITSRIVFPRSALACKTLRSQSVSQSVRISFPFICHETS